MITIQESEYKQIISELGYPVVKEEDLEFSRQDIQDLFIYPAMREYFTWFPKELETAQSISNRFEIPFPDEYTYGIVDSRLNTSASGADVTASPFMNELVFNSRGSSGRGMYGTRNDYGMTAASFMERSERRAMNDYSKSYKISVDNSNKRVVGYTNVMGELAITWAKFSEDFEDIPFRRKSEVIDLSKSNALKGFAMLRGQMNTDIGVEFDTGMFEDRATSLREEVLEKWKSMTKVVVIRG